jgi:hypothetical protein
VILDQDQSEGEKIQMKRFQLKRRPIKSTWRAAPKNGLPPSAFHLPLPTFRFPLSAFRLLLLASGLLLSLLAGCQNRGSEVSVEALNAPPAKPTAPSAAPAPSIDPRVTDLERVKEGSLAPDFALENVDRKLYRLSDYKGKKNVVLVFYRGYF